MVSHISVLSDELARCVRLSDYNYIKKMYGMNNIKFMYAALSIVNTDECCTRMFYFSKLQATCRTVRLSRDSC